MRLSSMSHKGTATGAGTPTILHDVSKPSSKADEKDCARSVAGEGDGGIQPIEDRSCMMLG